MKTIGRDLLIPRKCIPFLLISLVLGCTTTRERTPAETKYSYIQNYECASRSTVDDDPQADWTSLGGFQVGPTHIKYKGTSGEKILRPFFSDGCSSSPDGFESNDKNPAWVQCCIHHDTAYWLGGTAEEKRIADNQLEKCIAERGYPKIGLIYNIFVSQFGGPNSSSTYRWGYGWNYRRPFGPLTNQEEEQIKNLYGSDKSSVQQKIAVQTSTLRSLCSHEDIGTRSFTSDEQSIYRYLNENLKNNDIVSWAKFSYFNQVQKEYLLKLENCSEPILFIMTPKTSQIIEASSRCPNLDSFKNL